MALTGAALILEVFARHSTLTPKEAAAFVAALPAASVPTPGAHIAAALTTATTNLSTSADGTAIAAAVNLAGTNLNALATKFNTLLTELQALGILA